MYDAIVVGAGPAGLSAALILGRCCRSVLVCDGGHPRNTASQGLNGFLTRDGIKPLELRRIGREQLGRYDTVEVRDIEVVDAEHLDDGHFEVTMADGRRARTRKLLLATGVVDLLPEITGFEEFYGRSVFHCPYCDGWEVRNQPLAIYGRGQHGKGLALELTAWSRDLVLCTDGPAELRSVDREHLARNDIQVREERIQRLEGTNGLLEGVRFVSREVFPRRAMFFSTGEHQRSDLARKLGCEFTAKGAVNTGVYETTNVPGLYVAGDASRLVQLTIVAAAEGAEAAFAINTQLLKEDLL
ncbi:MAG TPA: NAD(P)/FAD-dependent oxidoreductase [Terriglobales bacterium]|nr:NAD(P)/FAD-dependent oxidoreductase [Terriglobales bacterium]